MNERSSRHLNLRRHPEEVNAYEFVLNTPVQWVDPEGLTLYYCTRKSDLGLGSNHGYFYDPDRDPHSCGQSQSSGGTPGLPPGNPGHDTGPSDPTQVCIAIPGTDDPDDQSLSDSLWACCQNTANQGPWIPGRKDCFNKLDNCLSQNNIQPPGHKRFGPPQLFPRPGKGPIFGPIFGPVPPPSPQF